MKVSSYFLQLARRAGTLVGLTYAFILFVIAPITLFIGLGSLVFLTLIISSATSGGIISVGSGDRIVVIPVRGEIVGSGQTGSDPAYASIDGYKIKDRLAELKDDASVKGVALEIDSPGGSIAGARAIAEGVAEYRSAAKRPIIAYVSGTAASGAYWAAASTDAIIADHGTDTGDIGVIMGPFESYRGVTAKTAEDGTNVTAAAINETYVTAGVGKDAGNPYRPLTAEETAHYQRGVDNIYTDFVNYVAERRNISPATIRNQIKAYAYDPATALGLKLIDAVGGRDTAMADLARRAGLTEGNYSIDHDEEPMEDGGIYGSAAIKKLKGAAEPAIAGLRLAGHRLLAR